MQEELACAPVLGIRGAGAVISGLKTAELLTDRRSTLDCEIALLQARRQKHQMTSSADHRRFPFEPRSSKDLEQGHYWGIPLSDGRFAAGVMLAHALRSGRRDGSIVVVGLLDWVSSSLPCESDFASPKIFKRAFVHVRAIESCGSMVIGRAVRDWGAAEVDFALAGAKVPAWGLLGLQYQAEMRWGDARLMAERLKADLRRPGK